MRRAMSMLAAAGLVASLAACAGGSGATPAPTMTIAPTMAAEASPASDTEASPAADVEPIDLVLLANSGGRGLAEPYAALAAEALGREVRAHDFIIDGAGPNDLLSMIQGSRADDVADAEIIVFIVSPIGVTPASHMPCIPFYEETWGEPPVMTSVEDWQDLRDALDRNYDEIWRLRAGQPTTIRVLGSFNPWFGQLQQAGIAPLCMANEEVRDQVERDAAEAAGAEFVSWLDLFNGPGHDVDPDEQGWLADGVHPNDAGRAVLVEALAATGWEASEPPG
jgi:hypothetical protein